VNRCIEFLIPANIIPIIMLREIEQNQRTGFFWMVLMILIDKYCFIHYYQR
jgi:hypothetical protein